MLAKQAAGLPVVTVNYRQQESFFIVPSNDKVTVIFLVAMGDETDRACTRVFLQEFVEAQRSVGNAPPCAYTREPPLELRDVRINIPEHAAGFLTFGTWLCGALSLLSHPHDDRCDVSQLHVLPSRVVYCQL